MTVDEAHGCPASNHVRSQELLVIRGVIIRLARSHSTPLRCGLIPYWCDDPGKGGRRPINAKCETVHKLPTFRDA